MSDYLAYQEKYREVPRASDVELIKLISKRTPKGGRILDVGCSTGNLLHHLHAARPDLELRGCDKDILTVVEWVKSGLPFECWQADVAETEWTDQWAYPAYDAVILNAVLYCLDDLQIVAALRNIHRVLKPGGHLFIWDLLHPWNQRLTIREESDRYGDVTYHIRPYKLLHDLAADNGYSMCEIHPCKQPRLPKPEDPDDLTSWTFPGWEKGGISFRGGVAQPWCHAVLTK